MPSPYMAGSSRRYAREAYLAGRGTVGGGLSASKLGNLSRDTGQRVLKEELTCIESPQ